jgi:hypothetical protein
MSTGQQQTLPTQIQTTSTPQVTRNWKKIIGFGVIVVVILSIVLHFTITNPFSEKDSTNSSASGRNTGIVEDGKWGDWTPECFQDPADQLWKISRKCEKDPINGGKPCNEIDGGDSVRLCAPLGGGWSDFPLDSDEACVLKKDSSGNPVKDSNGREMWFKTRKCDNPTPRNGGAGCGGSAEQQCNPIDGSWVSVPDSDQVCILQKDNAGNPIKDSTGRDLYLKNKICTGNKYGGICPGNPTEPCTAVNGNWSSGINEAPCLITTISYASSYPKENLTSNNNTDYKITTSSEAEVAWKAFDGQLNTFWQSGILYNSTTGKYSGNIKTVCFENDPSITRDVFGEWIQIELPIKILPQSFTITPRQDITLARKHSPVNFVLLASNDKNNWRVICVREGERWANIKEKRFDFSIFAKKPLYELYSMYRLVIGNVGAEGNSVQIAEMSIIPESPYYQTIECTLPKYGGLGCPVVASTNAIGNTVETDPLYPNKLRSQCARPSNQVQFSTNLPSKGKLSPGDSVVNGDYLLLLQQDGNLVLLWRRTQLLWQSSTNGNANCRAEMRGDGNFVIYSQYSNIIWDTATSGSVNRLDLTNDGTLSILSPSNEQIKILFQRTFTVVNNIENLKINTTVTSNNLLDPTYKYFMTGPWVTGTVPIASARRLPDDQVVYMIVQGGYLKMVTNLGESRYYPSNPDLTMSVDKFDPNAWDKYISSAGNYKLRICNSNCSPNGCNPDGSCLPISGCEADNANLTCSNGQVIQNAKIKYGRWNNTICPHSTVTSSTPARSKEYNLDSANGKTTYSLIEKHNNPDINDDPYFGVYKHWEITYSCVNP